MSTPARAPATQLCTPEELDQLFPRKDKPYFDYGSASPANKYVAWLDLMGARGIMGRVLGRAVNYIAKIHIVALEASGNGVRAYPVIDGCYLVAEKRDSLQEAIRQCMSRLGGAFVHEPDHEQRFLVRTGIAAGRLIEGADVTKGSNAFKNHKCYADCLAIGLPVGQAYSAEASAPPFGCWVDVTARAFKSGSAHPFTAALWRWWDDGTTVHKSQAELLGRAVMDYFEWAERNHRSLEYKRDRLIEHRDAAKEYFRFA